MLVALTARAAGPRASVELTDGWRTSLVGDTATARTQGPALPISSTAPREALPAFDDSAWRIVDVPHNWDDYGGATQVRHGNLHGSAWYRRTFTMPRGDDEPAASAGERRVFLFFEGVGSYATVWVNGREIGRHAGGLTTFTLDATAAVNGAGENTLVVRADHPEGIRDLPWVCGGCERVAGFSEGPQPFGIFRPVHVVVTNAVRVAPFGVHVWNDADLDPKAARVHLRTELTNHGAAPTKFTLRSRIEGAADRSQRPEAGGRTSEGGGRRLGVGDSGSDTGERSERTNARYSLPATRYSSEIVSTVTLVAGETRTIAQEPPPIPNATLWKPGAGHLYRVVTELLAADGKVLDREETPFGLRTIRWPRANDADGRFFVNGEPVFLNGTCDYEHNLGANYAFTDAQVAARVGQIEAAGFNAFRDAHHPHNLRFNERWDRDGLLWWTQFGAQIWFDRDDFRASFRTLLRDWVKERRNSPSLVLWGLQNESKLPEWFAKECSAIIREMDPTASAQRLITTCNGGAGTDWDVPQNWTGTYGGDPATYAEDLKRQRLVGEYGAWRSVGLRDERGYQLEGKLGEERFATLLETKIRLGESVRDASCGHFQWIFTTHANPGRAVGENGEQLFDGIDELDHVGPANNKGLFTQWGEPTDAFYVYRAHYTGKSRTPRTSTPSPAGSDGLTAPRPGLQYLYRVNCGGPEYVDVHGSRWSADRDLDSSACVATNAARTQGPPLHASVPSPNPGPDLASVPSASRGTASECLAKTSIAEEWGSVSWAAEYPHLDPRLGSQRATTTQITGTRDAALFQTFRYGREKLRYVFPVEPGDYEVELYFAEPWYGDAGIDATGWRLFDVAVNGTTAIRDLDLFREAGFGGALKKVVSMRVSATADGVAPAGTIEISFPRVAAGQAVISAIAIAAKDGPRSPARERREAPAAHAAGHAEAAPVSVIQRPPPPAQFIADLRIDDEPSTRGPARERRDDPAAHAAGHYALGGRLQIGQLTGPNDGDRVTKLSVSLSDSDWIRVRPNAGTSAGTDASPPPDAIAFTAFSSVEIYGSFGNQAPAGWLPATQRATLADGTTFTLHKRRAAAGERVRLASEVVAASPIFFIQAARVPVVVPLARDADGTPAWTIQVGVGDRYGLNFNYRNTTGAPVAAKLAIVQADGTTLRTEALEFPPSPAGDAWSILRARTGSSINAGTYRLRLTVPAGVLTLGDLEVE